MIQHLNLVGGSFRVDSLEDKLDEANGEFSESTPEIIGENYELKLSNDIFIDNKKVLYPDDCIEVKTENRTKNSPETVPVFSIFFLISKGNSKRLSGIFFRAITFLETNKHQCQQKLQRLQKNKH
jgi:hypothetical protein